MPIVFLIWPALLLPVLLVWLAWLTRPNPSAAALADSSAPITPATASAPAQKTAGHTPVYCRQAQRAYREMLELAAEQRRRESPAYRKAAQAAYHAMQQMHDEMSEDAPPSSTVDYSQATMRTTNAPPSSVGTSRNPLIRLG